MEKLIVSMMRFSTAVTLFGLEQLESAMNVATGEDLSETMDRFRTALDSVTDAVSKELNHSKQATLKSVTQLSEQAAHRAVNGLVVVDPRDVLRSTSDLMKKTSDSVADFIAKGADTVGETLEETTAKEKPRAKHHTAA